MQGLLTNPCTAEDRRKCETLTGGGKNLEWACKNCKQQKPENLSPYAVFVLQVLRAQDGGLALPESMWDHLPDPLSVWADIGDARRIMDQARESNHWQSVLAILNIALRLGPMAQRR